MEFLYIMDETPEMNKVKEFLSKHGDKLFPSSLFFVVMYLSFQIMSQVTSIQTQLAEIRAQMLTRELVHEIAKQENLVFYHSMKKDIEDIVDRKILEYHDR